MPHSFVPETWTLTDKLKDYARSKGYTDKHLIEEEEKFRLCQFNRVMKDWDRCWQRWVLNSIKWGEVVPATNPVYNKPQELTDAQKAEDLRKWEADMKRLRVVK